MPEFDISTNSDNDYSPNQDRNVNTSDQRVLPQNSEFGTAKHTRSRTIRPPSRYQDYVMNWRISYLPKKKFSVIFLNIKKKRDFTVGNRTCSCYQYYYAYCSCMLINCLKCLFRVIVRFVLFRRILYQSSSA